MAAADSGVSNEGVARWLAKAGLSRYVPRFVAEGVDDEAFKQLMMQDYPRFGIEAVADKQKLFKLIRSLQPPPPPRVPTPPRDDAWHRAGLLDVHALEDADLLGEGDGIDPAFMLLSPDAGVAGRQAFVRASGGAARPSPPPAFVDDGLPRIRVLVRKRPLNSREKARKEDDVVEMRRAEGSLTVYEPRTKVDLTRYTECHTFAFDQVLDETTSNDEVYASAVAPLVGVVFRRGKATCFAYGQTGSGKTFTMQPLPVRAAREMLDTLATEPAYASLHLCVSYFEIYGGRVFDLLSERKKLCIRETGTGEIVVVGLREYPVVDVAGVTALIDHGQAARSTGSTGANADSSRSHAILQLSLRRRVPGAPAGGVPGEDGVPPLGRMYGKFSFIDLAGSERGADTADTDRQTRLEGAEINKSLLALKECIRALDQDRAAGGAGRHIPFRGSKLTEVLRDSFGGDGRTVMIANISPASGSCEHTMNTLRYADRVKDLRRDGRAPAAQAPVPMPPPASAYVADEGGPQAPRPGARAGALPTRGSAGQLAEAARPGSRSAPRGSADVSPTRASGVNNLPPRAPAAAAPVAAGLAAYDSSPPAATTPEALEAAEAEAAEEENLLAAAHDELMHTILEEEEDIIAAHRRQIEDTMEAVRNEMALLQEVDRAGSAIDAYVSGLTEILAARAASVAALQARLTTFQRHLKEEEILSRTVGFKQR